MFHFKRVLKMKRPVLKIILCAVIIITVKHFYWTISNPTDYPIIIWWTSNFPGFSSNVRRCKNNVICEFTNSKERRLDQNTEGFLFYGSDFDYLELPLPRDPLKHVWGLIHEESPRNTPILQHGPALQLFNFSSTISRHSDIPLTLLYLGGMHELLTHKHFIETSKKNSLLKQFSPVLYIQTDCDTSSYRDIYVKELMKYIPVDSYGKCLNNKQLPKEYGGDYLNNLNSDDFLNFVAQYKFTISFENAVCDDYITEKLWRPLKVGSVPIYMGSPSIRDWLPNDESAVITTNFDSPKHLAAYIEYLNTHDDKYEVYLQHKLSNKITNSKLVKALDRRSSRVDGFTFDKFTEAFECFVCEKIHERRKNKEFKYSIADRSHYSCPQPKMPFKINQLDKWWIEQWAIQKHKASVLNRLVMKENKVNLTEKDFSKESNELLDTSNLL